MMKALFSRLKSSSSSSSSRPFKDFYKEWINTLKTTHLPLLSKSLSSPYPDTLLLAAHVDLIHTHFRSYFNALNLASNDDVSHLLYPQWRNPLEKPFLWLGDFHPYIFTTLLRSFLEDNDDDDTEEERSSDDGGQGFESLGKHWDVVMAWKNGDKSLGHKVEQIECGLRLMVPAIAARARDAQGGLVDKLAVGWRNEGDGLSSKVGEIVGEVVDELTSVFLDGNRLRRSVLADILGALNVYQSALFLEGLAQFYVGFWDSKLLSQFKKTNLPLY